MNGDSAVTPNAIPDQPQQGADSPFESVTISKENKNHDFIG